MGYFETRMEYYKSAIVRESERWLLLGKPIPLFFFTPAGSPPHKYRPPRNVRDLAPDGSGEELLALDHCEHWEELKRQFPEATQDLQNAPSRHYATVVMLKGVPRAFMRLDLGHDRKIVDTIEKQKIQTLVESLSEVQRAATSYMHPGDELPLRRAIEKVLTTLLGHPAVDAEVEHIIRTLSELAVDD